MIILDYKDRRPIYEQIVEKISELIIRGILKPDEKMPSVRSLAMELSINPNTIQRAYGELERQGLLYSVKGRGSFVMLNDCLVEQKQADILDELEENVKKAKAHKMKKETIFDLVEKIYEGGEEK